VRDVYYDLSVFQRDRLKPSTPVLRIGHYPEPTPMLPTGIATHKCRYVRHVVLGWVFIYTFGRHG
jgi:hypothetical protein